MNTKSVIRILLISTFSLTASVSFSNILTCWSVENKAVAGYQDASVSAYCSYWYREARFSVNGAQTGSPPQELIQAGLLSIKNGTIITKLQSSKITELAAAILAANRVKEVPEEVNKKLSENIDGLLQCFEDFYQTMKEKRQKYFKTFVNNTVNCTVASTATVELSVVDSKDTILLKADEPTINITVVDHKNAINTLSIPASYIEKQCN